MRWHQVLLIVSLTFAGCQHRAEEAAHEATEARPRDSLNLRLAADAQAAIGLVTGKIETREVRQSISATGWLAAPPASEIVVKAPAAGFVTLNDDNSPLLGESVTKNHLLATLHVYLSPQEQAQLVADKEDADILIEQSQTTAELAEAQLKRIEENASNAVVGTRLIELRETIARSRAAEQAAREKLPFLPQEPYNDDVGLKTLPVKAPAGGRLVNIHFVPRQFLVQGDPLWTIADWSRLWIHVPVYAGNLSKVDKQEPAVAVVPGETEVYEAKPVNVLLPTEPGKQTVELLYEIDNQAENLRPGQALLLSLPSGKQVPEIVIPRSAVLWDGMGNSWVYARTSPPTFRRCRVELGPYLGDDVVVRRGVKEGDEIVTTGAEILYGEEFKGQLQAGDDD